MSFAFLLAGEIATRPSGMGPGDAVCFEPMPDGRVAISPANKKAKDIDNPFAAFKGGLKGGLGPGITTDALMRMTRGDDWNQP